MVGSHVTRIFVASLIVGTTLVTSAVSSSASSRFHIVVVGMVPTNEGSNQCDLTWSNQGTSQLDKPLKVEVAMESGVIDRSFSGLITVEEGPPSTTMSCPFITPAGLGTGEISTTTVRLWKGVANVTHIKATAGGTYPVEFTYKGLSTVNTLMQLNAEPPGTPTSGGTVVTPG